MDHVLAHLGAIIISRFTRGLESEPTRLICLNAKVAETIKQGDMQKR